MTAGHFPPRTTPISVIVPKRLCCLKIFHCLSYRLYYIKITLKTWNAETCNICHNAILHNINMHFFKTYGRFSFRIISEIIDAYCFTHSGILISLRQQNIKTKKCSRVANKRLRSRMTHAFVIYPFHPVELNETG